MENGLTTLSVLKFFARMELKFSLVLLSVFLSFPYFVKSQEIFDSEDWSFDQLVPENYRHARPPKIGNQPAVVNITLVLNQLISTNEAEQSLTLDLFFWLRWFDPRIGTPEGFEATTLDQSWKKKLWIPNLYFGNSLHSSPVDIKASSLYLEVGEKSRFVMSTRVMVKLGCHMDLFSFPQDTQICSIDLACVDWKNESVHFVWEKFEIREMDEFPKYEITDYRISDCLSVRGPEYPCLSVRLRLFRRFSYYFIRIYGPSILLVLTSFMGFWIPPIGFPARTLLVVTPLLSLVTQQAQINSEINVSYVVALHIWNMVCIIFEFMALLEYALAIWYAHTMEEKKEIYQLQSHDGLTYSFKSSPTSHMIKVLLKKVYGDVDWTKGPMDINKVDYCARLVFPALFFVFIILYSCIFIFPWLSSKYL